ncbi:hypothetical protein ACFQU7_15905 [Pseudoroseomonas wenyumeiae]
MRDPASGAWVVPPEALAGLTLTPPADFSGEIRLVLRALAMQPDGRLLTAVQALDVTVAPVADAALIDASPAAGREDVPLALNLHIAPADADGSESLVSVLLSGLPPGARIAPGEGITDHGDGTWSMVPAHLAAVMLIPPEHASGGMRLTVTAVTMEAASGATRATAQEVEVSFAPVPQAPLLQAGDAAGREDQPIALDLGATLADRDGSENLSLVLEGLPHGARLSAGVNNGDGSWTLTPAQLAGLTLTPPGNWSGRMALTLVAHAMEGADASHATSRAGFAVAVEAVADRPMLDVAATAEGGEDSLLALDLRARLTDGDGSESLFLRVTGVPAGSRFNAGSENADGSWTIPGDALPGLGFQPPRDYSGTLRLRFAALAVEGNGDAASTDPIEMSITVRPVTDAPLLALADATGAEDQPLALSIAAAPGMPMARKACCGCWCRGARWRQAFGRQPRRRRHLDPAAKPADGAEPDAAGAFLRPVATDRHRRGRRGGDGGGGQHHRHHDPAGDAGGRCAGADGTPPAAPRTIRWRFRSARLWWTGMAPSGCWICKSPACRKASRCPPARGWAVGPGRCRRPAWPGCA